jgi:ryanodine receptor 2
VFFILNVIKIKSGFSLNGELLMDALGGETTFADVQGDNFVPACTLGVGQKAR